MARVLMVAYSCEPGVSSEGAVGWELVSRLARKHSVRLLTRPKAQDSIERSIQLDSSMDLSVEYHEMTGLRRLKYLGLPVSNLRYLAWNHRLSYRVKELASKHDLVHHTTWVRHWMPSAAGRSEGTAFLWGPVGAAERPPWSLVRTLGWRGIVGEVGRSAGRVALSIDPLMRRTLRTVDHAVASSPDTARWMVARGVPTSLLPSVGFDPREISMDGRRDVEHDFISVGRLLDWKGFHLGLRAFSALPGNSRYLIVGDGPAASRLKRLTVTLGVADRVDFAGRLPRESVLEALGRSGVLVHPSLHDSGGFVVVEAMALGIPAVTLDIGGPPFLAGAGGITVSPGPIGTLVDRLGEAMGKSLEHRDSYSEAAKNQAARLTWERIADEYDRIYASLVGGDGKTPPAR